MPNPIEIEVNGKRYSVHYEPQTPLLYVLRDELGLTHADDLLRGQDFILRKEGREFFGELVDGRSRIWPSRQ